MYQVGDIVYLYRFESIIIIKKYTGLSVDYKVIYSKHSQLVNSFMVDSLTYNNSKLLAKGNKLTKLLYL